VLSLYILISSRREKQRRKTHDGEEPEEETEYTTEIRTEIVKGKRKKVEVKAPKNPVKKATPNMIKKKDKLKEQRRAKRIDVLASKLPDLDMAENPLNDTTGNPLPMPTYQQLVETATEMVDNIPWKDLRPILADEGVSENSLPPISPDLSLNKAGKS
jgi:hypothetical protein